MDGSARRQMLRTRWRLSIAVMWLVAALGFDELLPAAPVVEEETPHGCHVNGRIVSTAWKELGGGIERAIVSVWTLPERERVDEVYAEGERFEFHLPPGNYRLDCSAIGTRGATFKVLSREISVAEDQDRLDIGQIDLPISKTTGLYGKPAPELDGDHRLAGHAPHRAQGPQRKGRRVGLFRLLLLDLPCP